MVIPKLSLARTLQLVETGGKHGRNGQKSYSKQDGNDVGRIGFPLHNCIISVRPGLNFCVWKYNSSA
jgi:hypothetical protein